ncbi:MAG: ribbon-helix-helix domain-containing protein [Candidatus Woesearchaeota archaeon]
MRKYTNVALPSDLIEEIDKVIKKRGLGYKSRGEFVKEAARNLLKEIKQFDQTSRSSKTDQYL